MDTLQVSIIIPCYNQAAYLPDALESVIAQTIPLWEAVVVNDASPDNTTEVASFFAKKDPRIRLMLLEKNGGLANARNRGIAATTAPFILPLDADDAIVPTFLEESLLPFREHGDLKVVYADAVKFGVLNESWQHPNFDLKKLCKANLFQPGALFTREAFNGTEGYRPNMVYGFEDWDLWLQMIEKDDEAFHIRRPLFRYRVNPGSMVRALQGNKEKVWEMRKRAYLNNRKKIQIIYPEFAYWWERQLSKKDYKFIVRYRLENGLKKLTQ
jgi:glycosyltransferase involved in cell wall biosynthesis